MAECFAGGHLRYQHGEWRDDNGDPIPIRRITEGEWELSKDDYFNLHVIRCSICHEEWCFEEEGDVVAMHYNYCPKCGNPMKVKRGDT